MGAVKPLKGSSSDSMTWSDSYKFNANYVYKYLCKNILYLTLVHSSPLYFHVTSLVVLIWDKVKSFSTLGSVVIFPAFVYHCITESFLLCSFPTRLPITIVEICPLYNRIRKFLNLDLPFFVFIRTCRIGDNWIIKNCAFRRVQKIM